MKAIEIEKRSEGVFALSTHPGTLFMEGPLREELATMVASQPTIDKLVGTAKQTVLGAAYRRSPRFRL